MAEAPAGVGRCDEAPEPEEAEPTIDPHERADHAPPALSDRQEEPHERDRGEREDEPDMDGERTREVERVTPALTEPEEDRIAGAVVEARIVEYGGRCRHHACCGSHEASERPSIVAGSMPDPGAKGEESLEEEEDDREVDENRVDLSRRRD